MEDFDVVVAGSGLGGLLAAVILAKEGMKVAVVEQNKQVGGCLQTFSFDKKLFDSCVHYIAAMDDGQTQHRIFNYAGILDQLNFRRMPEEGFDHIFLGDAPQAYPIGQGEHFIPQLLTFFPDQREALQTYTQTLQSVGEAFPFFSLQDGDDSAKQSWLSAELEGTLKALVPHDKLRNVLLGNGLLYAGAPGRTPFYTHALVNRSFMDSAYRCEGGSSRIAKALWRQLVQHGGKVFNREEVNRLNLVNGSVRSLHTTSGLGLAAKHFIVNVHPAKVLDWLGEQPPRRSMEQRLNLLQNSISAFMVNLVLKPGEVPYSEQNLYWNRYADVLQAVDYRPADWPGNYALYFSEDPERPGFADTLCILTYMHTTELEAWQGTHNRTAAPSVRCPDYQAFKTLKARRLIAAAERQLAGLSGKFQSVKVATPLTFRDYMGSPDGAMYGLQRDVERPEISMLSNVSRLPNLYFTGQNIGLHGVLGVSINAVELCARLLGRSYLLEKINAL